jgi:uncharacterized protein (DUF1684 family)
MVGLQKSGKIADETSQAEAAEAERILKVCLGPNAPQSLLDFFTSHQPPKVIDLRASKSCPSASAGAQLPHAPFWPSKAFNVWTPDTRSYL